MQALSSSSRIDQGKSLDGTVAVPPGRRTHVSTGPIALLEASATHGGFAAVCTTPSPPTLNADAQQMSLSVFSLMQQTTESQRQPNEHTTIRGDSDVFGSPAVMLLHRFPLTLSAGAVAVTKMTWLALGAIAILDNRGGLTVVSSGLSSAGGSSEEEEEDSTEPDEDWENLTLDDIRNGLLGSRKALHAVATPSRRVATPPPLLCNRHVTDMSGLPTREALVYTSSTAVTLVAVACKSTSTSGREDRAQASSPLRHWTLSGVPPLRGLSLMALPESVGLSDAIPFLHTPLLLLLAGFTADGTVLLYEVQARGDGDSSSPVVRLIRQLLWGVPNAFSGIACSTRGANENAFCLLFCHQAEPGKEEDASASAALLEEHAVLLGPGGVPLQVELPSASKSPAPLQRASSSRPALNQVVEALRGEAPHSDDRSCDFVSAIASSLTLAPPALTVPISNDATRWGVLELVVTCSASGSSKDGGIAPQEQVDVRMRVRFIDSGFAEWAQRTTGTTKSAATFQMLPYVVGTQMVLFSSSAIILLSLAPDRPTVELVGASTLGNAEQAAPSTQRRLCGLVMRASTSGSSDSMLLMHGVRMDESNSLANLQLTELHEVTRVAQVDPTASSASAAAFSERRVHDIVRQVVREEMKVLQEAMDRRLSSLEVKLERMCRLLADSHSQHSASL